MKSYMSFQKLKILLNKIVLYKLVLKILKKIINLNSCSLQKDLLWSQPKGKLSVSKGLNIEESAN